MRQRKATMMISSKIECRTEDNVAMISIDTPPGDRAALADLALSLAETCQAIASESGINVVTLTGGKDAFHLGEIRDCPFPPEGEGAGISLAAAVSSLDCPVIAGVDGRITGPGLELVLACDIRLATAGSSFCLPQLLAGQLPCDGGTQRLSRTVGKAKALEMILTGQVIEGEEAVRIGLINRLVDAADLIASTREIARKMALQAPQAMKYAKEAISQGLEMNIHQGLRLEADLYFLLHTTGDRREGIEAFLEKRKPQFKGE